MSGQSHLPQRVMWQQQQPHGHDLLRMMLAGYAQVLQRISGHAMNLDPFGLLRALSGGA